jgi:anti-sigma-K factor RskA
MQSGLEPTEPPSTYDAPDQTQSLATHTTTSNLTVQNRLAFWRLRGCFTLISLVLAGIIALVAQSTYIETASFGGGWGIKQHCQTV